MTLALLLGACAATGPEPGHLSICLSPDAAPEQAARFCRRALGSQALTGTDRAQTATSLGLALMALDAPGQARPAFDEALAADPDYAPAYAGRARALEAADEITAAMADWDRALTLSPEDPALLTGRGGLAVRRGDPAAALADFEAAQRRGDPEDTGYAYNRGIALGALGRMAEAEAAFSEVLRRDAADAGAYLNRARTRAARDAQAALADFSRAIELAPQQPVPHYERGELRARLGRAATADQDFRRAWELGLRNEALAAHLAK